MLNRNSLCTLPGFCYSSTVQIKVAGGKICQINSQSSSPLAQCKQPTLQYLHYIHWTLLRSATTINGPNFTFTRHISSFLHYTFSTVRFLLLVFTFDDIYFSNSIQSFIVFYDYYSAFILHDTLQRIPTSDKNRKLKNCNNVAIKLTKLSEADSDWFFNQEQQ